MKRILKATIFGVALAFSLIGFAPTTLQAAPLTPLAPVDVDVFNLKDI